MRTESNYIAHINHNDGTWDEVAWVDTVNHFHYLTHDVRAPFGPNDFYTGRPLDNTYGHAKSDDDWAIGDAGKMHIVFGAKNPTTSSFTLSLKKVAAEKCVENLTANYSLAGARYEVFLDAACTKPAKDSSGNAAWFITDKKGTGHVRGKLQNADYVGDTVLQLPISNSAYYVKETHVGAAGWGLDTKVYKVSTSEQNKHTEVASPFVITSKETPIADPAHVQKVDADTGAIPAGDTNLAGIKFKLAYWDTTGTTKPNSAPQATVTVQTDSKGHIEFRTAAAIDGTKWSLITNTGERLFPVGLYEITEVNSGATHIAAGPWLYRVDRVWNDTAKVYVGKTTQVTKNFATAADPSITFSLPNKAKKNSLVVQKRSRETNEVMRATFALINDSANPIAYKGKTYKKGATIATLSGTEVTFADLPLGTYIINETGVAKDTYRVDPIWSGPTLSGGAVASATKNGHGYKVKISGGNAGKVTIKATDSAVRGDVSLKKVNIYNEPEKATFSIYNVTRGTSALSSETGQKATYVPTAYDDYAKLADPAARQAWIAAHKSSLICTISSDGTTGIAATKNGRLLRGAPDGTVYTYVILETTPGDGSMYLDTKWYQTIRIDKNGRAINVNADWSDGTVANFTNGGTDWASHMRGTKDSGPKIAGEVVVNQRWVKMPFTGGAGIAVVVLAAFGALAMAGVAWGIRSKK